MITSVEDIQKTLAALAAPFGQDDILQDAQHSDGFRPNYIPWDKIVRRLESATNGRWSWTVRKYDFVHNQAVVHGTLSIYIGDELMTRDGIGSVELTINNGVYANMGDDMKSAETEAMKRAATKFGVGLQLYDRDFNRRQLATQASQAAQEPKIQPFQVDKARKALEAFQCPEVDFCNACHIAGLSQLTPSALEMILAGSHPVLQARFQNRGPVNGRPRAGMQSSNA